MLFHRRFVTEVVALALLANLGCQRAAIAPGQSPAKAPESSTGEAPRTVNADGATYYFEKAGVHARVQSPAPHLVRVELSSQRDFPRVPSFAVGSPAPSSTSQAVESVRRLDFKAGTVEVAADTLQLSFLDPAAGQITEMTAPDFSSGNADLEFSLEANAHIFGLGDKGRGEDRRGHSFELWNTDAYGFKPDTDPLYKSIPFLLIAQPGRSFGLFFDTAARAHIDAGKDDPSRLSVSFEHTETLVYYVFTAKTPGGVLKSYTELTGRTPLPPLWALGYHQSRYGYLTEKEVRGVVERLQEGRHPTDAIWLDIDYQRDNAPFTVNTDAFPSLPQMVEDFHERGVKTVVITDPHIKSYQGATSPSGYAPFDSGVAGDHFIRDAKEHYFEGKVWPGASVFPEFTLSRTRKWWGTLYTEFAALGLDGFWNDMNEPALFVDTKTMPTTVQHRLEDGRTTSHTHIHNAYGLLNARATYEGLRELRPNQRPFILTRAASAGVQRYAASWTGDNTADRPHLALSISQLNNLGVSGYPFVGADIGGFIGCPDPDLLAEWMELGAFQPFYRNHSQKKSCRREPWVHGPKVEARIRRALERRYQLLPYLYTLFEESSRNGSPIVRPVWFEYPNTQASYNSPRLFLLGSHLLLSPKVDAGLKPYVIALPPGTWFDSSTGVAHPGDTRLEITPAAENSVRELVRAGSILPEGPTVQNVEELPGQPLTLHVWPGEHCHGSLYTDDGTTFDYQKPSGYRRIEFSCQQSGSGLSITASSSGTRPPWWSKIVLEVHAESQARRSVQAKSSGALASDYLESLEVTRIELPGAVTDFSVQLQ